MKRNAFGDSEIPDRRRAVLRPNLRTAFRALLPFVPKSSEMDGILRRSFFSASRSFPFRLIRFRNIPDAAAGFVFCNGFAALLNGCR